MLQADGDSKEINDEEAKLQKMFAKFSELNLSSKPLIQDKQEKASVEKKQTKKNKAVMNINSDTTVTYKMQTRLSSKRASHKGSESSKEAESNVHLNY